MKKYLKGLLMVLLLFVCLTVVKANDRIVINQVEITSNMPIPAYGGEAANNYQYNTSNGMPAYMTPHMGDWYVRNGDTWVRYNSSLFKEGEYKYYNQIRIDGPDGLEYELSEGTKLFVDGSEWVKGNNINIEPTYSMIYYYSPIYVVEKDNDFELTFVNTRNLYVSESYVNTAINEFSVVNCVLGGTEPYTFSKVSGPSWVNVSASGTVSGTPTVAGENADLVIRVTDEEDNSKEMTVPVRATNIDPNSRVAVTNVVLTSNMHAPVYGEVVPNIYTYTTVEGDPVYMTPHMGAWYTEDGRRYNESTFKEGRYYFKNQIRIDGQYGSTHRLDENTRLYVDGEEWTIDSSSVSINPTYSMIYYASPIYEVIATPINEVNITGIVEPVEGAVPETLAVNVEDENISIRDVNWYLDDGNYDPNKPVTRFAANKRYMLVITFDTNVGYKFADDFDDGNINTNLPYLKAEFVSAGPDVRIYYEAKSLPRVTVAPKIKVSNANNNSVLVSWDAVENATKYDIYRSENKKKWSRVGSIDSTSFTNTGLTYGKTYYYKVTASNSASNKTSAIVSGKTVPNKMVIKTYGEGTNNVKIAWDKVSVNGYELYRSTNNKKWTKIKTITKNSTLAFNNTKLKANTTYYYKARAYKTVSGRKVYGPWSVVVKTKTAPVKPSVSLTLLDDLKLKFSFKGVSGASYYKMELSTESKFVDEGVIRTTATSPITETSEPYSLGTTIYMRVRACNSLDKCSAWTTVSRKVTPKTPGFTLKTTSKKVIVTLSKVNAADGYEIFRATSKKGKYTLVKSFTSEDELLQYVNNTTKGKTYYYKVRSYKLDDSDKKVYSPLSGIKSIRSK